MRYSHDLSFGGLALMLFACSTGDGQTPVSEMNATTLGATDTTDNPTGSGLGGSGTQDATSTMATDTALSGINAGAIAGGTSQGGAAGTTTDVVAATNNGGAAPVIGTGGQASTTPVATGGSGGSDTNLPGMGGAGLGGAGQDGAGTAVAGTASLTGGAGGVANGGAGGSMIDQGTAGADSGLGDVEFDPALLNSCSGNGPITCSIDIPNGNYQVVAELGSAAQAASTRIQSELFRISWPETATGAGELLTVSFAVNVREEKHDGYSAPGGVLNLLFDGGSPQLNALAVVPAPNIPTVFVAGDSTVCDWEPTASNVSSANQRGWAQALTQHFKPGVAIANYADSGETAGGFYGKFWTPAREALRAGDYVFIQFGHNDQKNQSDIDNYKSNLMRYVNDARAANATPVIFTPVNRKNTSPNFAGLDGQARELAADEGVELIDLTNLSVEFYRDQSDLNQFFADGDGTHLSDVGATAISGLVAEAIKGGSLPLSAFVR